MPTPCPVCSYGVYTDPRAPMADRGTDNPARHRCDDNDTWRQRTKFGGSKSALAQRLLDTPMAKLEGWPRVAELKRKVENGEW